ncbi:MAG: hypothetical protein U5K69_10050 [Balneolaceae bacterium]|nr:hypothetical protein [Balneolaceae bacterium]
MNVQHAITHLTGSIVIFLMLLFTAGGCGSDSTGPYGGNNGNGGNGNGGQPGFSSGSLSQGESFSYTFEDEGTVECFCDIHAPDMQGVVSVNSSATSEQDTVEMINNQFVSGQITVAPNTEVTWINRDNAFHTVVEGNPTTGNDGDGDGY